jgi:hypothetical protein
VKMWVIWDVTWCEMLLKNCKCFVEFGWTHIVFKKMKLKQW